MNLWGFISAAVLLTLMPGPDILFVITQSITRGRKAGMVFAAGLCTGFGDGLHPQPEGSDQGCDGLSGRVYGNFLPSRHSGAWKGRRPGDLGRRSTGV